MHPDVRCRREPLPPNRARPNSLLLLFMRFCFPQKMPVIHADWSNLPEELLEPIFLRLEHAGDLFRFGAVCRSWRSVAAQSRQRLCTQLRPLLLLTTYCHGRINYDLFDFSRKKFCRLQLPEVGGRAPCCVANGWLVTTGCYPVYPIHLVNPLSRAQIELPPLIFGMACSIHKVITSSSPLDPDCIVMVIYGALMQLAYCRVGDKEWKYFRSEAGYFMDLLYYKGRFYAVKEDGRVVRCDIDSEPKVTQGAPSARRVFLQQNYLVESSGDFLKVIRCFQRVDSSYRLVFRIFKEDFEEGKWEEVHSLGDDSLFLGCNQSFIISTREFPEFKGDCIYFSKNCWESYQYMGDMLVFDMKTWCTHPLERTFQSSEAGKFPFFWLYPELSCLCSSTAQKKN